jgi:tRNA U38,U39,U40 pseudouridine synthase TruA
MVRLLTGSMVRVAQGKAPLEWLTSFLETPSADLATVEPVRSRKPRPKTSFAAPAEGLYLVKVDYAKPR